MADPRVVAAVADANSHAPAKKPRRKPALLDAADRGANQPREALDAHAEVPLHVRPVLTYAELAALGICPERTLRRLVAIGTVKRAVLRLGRSVRFVVQDLLDELRGTQE